MKSDGHHYFCFDCIDFQKNNFCFKHNKCVEFFFGGGGQGEGVRNLLGRAETESLGAKLLGHDC